MELIDSQKRFADRYFETLNATQSAIYAGYSPATAAAQGWQLLQLPAIKAYLDELRTDLSVRTNISQEKILRQLARLAFSDIRDYYNEDGSLKNITDLSDDAAAALSGVETEELFEFVERNKELIGYAKKIKMASKYDGIDKLMKHLGMFEKDNEQQAKQKITVTIE